MYSNKDHTFEDHNVLDSEITNFYEYVPKLCESSASYEMLDDEFYVCSNKTDVFTPDPSNSTALGSQDTNTLPSPLEFPVLNLARGISEDSMQAKDSEGLVDMKLSQEFRQVMDERATIHDATMLTTTAYTNGPVETREEIAKLDDYNGSDYNGNGAIAGMEIEEEKVKPKSEQSRYKNKPKELLQKAVQIYNHVKDSSKADYDKMMTEYYKNDEEWTRDELEAKEYCCFAGLYGLMPEILGQVGAFMENFNGTYKDKISQIYFKNADNFESKDFFSWMLLVQIVLVLIPEDPEYIELLPLKKSTICLSTWLLGSKMIPENKDIYKNSTNRKYLRIVMTKIYNNLMNQASTKMDQNRHKLLQRVSEALGTRFAPMQESPRRVARVVKARVSPHYSEIDDGISGKRTSSKAPKLSYDKTTKKVKKQKK